MIVRDLTEKYIEDGCFDYFNDYNDTAGHFKHLLRDAITKPLSSLDDLLKVQRIINLLVKLEQNRGVDHTIRRKVDEWNARYMDLAREVGLKDLPPSAYEECVFETLAEFCNHDFDEALTIFDHPKNTGGWGEGNVRDRILCAIKGEQASEG